MSFRKIIRQKDFAYLLSRLKDDFPLAKSTWQVVRDTQDGLMEANLYTDEWPDFTTVVSQEFAPRLSEVADLRIHTRNKERVMQVINGAKLLEKIGKWQKIMYYTGLEEESLTKHLLEAFSSHRAASDRVVQFYSSPFYHMPVSISDLPDRKHWPLPPGYEIRDLLPEHAELAAKHWEYESWPWHLPPEQKLRYIKEIIERFDVLGVFTEDKPVSWSFRKPGGVYEIAYTIPEHRGKCINHSLTRELELRTAMKNEVAIKELTRIPADDSLYYEHIGLSNYIIVLQHPNII